MAEQLTEIQVETKPDLSPVKELTQVSESETPETPETATPETPETATPETPEDESGVSDSGDVLDNEVVVSFQDKDELIFYLNEMTSKTNPVDSQLLEQCPYGYSYRMDGVKAVFSANDQEGNPDRDVLRADWSLLGQFLFDIEKNTIDFIWASCLAIKDENGEQLETDQLPGYMVDSEKMRMILYEDPELRYLSRGRVFCEDSMLLHILKAYCIHHLELDYISDFINPTQNTNALFGYRNLEWLDITDCEAVGDDLSAEETNEEPPANEELSSLATGDAVADGLTTDTDVSTVVSDGAEGV